MKTILFIFLIVLTVESGSQVTQEWTKSYNGPGWGIDEINGIAVDGNGNVYVSGSSVGEDENNSDFATIKYNSAGVQQWVKRYDFNHSPEYVRAMTIDASGNIYVTGVSHNYGVSDDFATIKYNSAGVQQWVKRYNGPSTNSDDPASITVDNAGNVYVTGYSYSNVGGGAFATIKYNSSGAIQWLARYNRSGNSLENPRSIKVDSEQNVYVAGYTENSETDRDYLIVKYNSSGTEQWAKTYDGPGNGIDEVKDLILDESANVYVTGFSNGSGTKSDITTIKYTPYGNAVWIKRYNGFYSDSDYGQSIALDENRNVYVAGTSKTGTNTHDNITIKYNSSGTQQWVEKYSEAQSSNHSEKIVLDGSGNVYVTGTTRDFNSENDFDFLTIKYNSSGTRQWIKKYEGTGDAVARYITVDNAGNVYVAGYSEGLGSLKDFRTIKYSQTQQRFISGLPTEYSLSQNYPNPFNPATNIGLRIAHFGFVSLKVFDITGKEVAVLVNNELDAGDYNVNFDASQLSSGTYFYRIEAGQFTEVKKMILIK